VDNGILVNQQGVTSHPDVFAAGDVANQDHPVLGRRVRVEHFDNALKQGAAVGKSMLGSTDPIGDVHWFWSDQYDHNCRWWGTRCRGTGSRSGGASRIATSSPST
jgi:3-phenylpropionate/trans-cinnamate dioxygenase ferredoxin reductase subunit